MRFMNLIEPWRGGGTIPPRAPFGRTLRAGLGGMIALTLVACLADFSGMLLVLGSFGATCVLVFGYPESPFSQPRSVIGDGDWPAGSAWNWRRPVGTRTGHRTSHCRHDDAARRASTRWQ
jgi:HPP family